jgi:hypothetical protein
VTVRVDAGWRRLSVAALCAVTIGCGAPRVLLLPTEGGSPVSDAGAVYDAAFRRCADLRTLSAEIAVSGRAGRQKIRARLLAGFSAPGAIRLEAVAPFGRPGFILAADATEATLLLPRDGRVLTGAAPADILEALSGIPLSPDDLRRVLAGCPDGSATVVDARRYGTTWTVLDFGEGRRAYFRARSGQWPLTALVRPGLVAEYMETVTAGAQPPAVRLRDDPCGPANPSCAAAADGRFDVTLRLSQVEVNVLLPADAFTVSVPPDAAPISLDELRDAGPMRDLSAEKS